MAYCKMHAITNSMSKALAYIENPEKTDGQLFVTGYGVQPCTASLEMEITKQMALDAIGDRSVAGKANNLCYHLIQSFSPADHLTPQQAHEIGQRLADELLGGRFEYVVATHLDKGHVHNHIIFNSTSFCDYRKFRSVPFRTIRMVNAISDRLCAQHNLSLSTLHRQQAAGVRFQPQQWSRYSSWRQEIRKRLRFALETAEDYEQFREITAALGVTVRDDGQHVTYLMDGQQRPCRDTTLDREGSFTLEGLQREIETGCECRERLKSAIRNAAAGVADYRTFQKKLEAMDIRVKHLKAGTIYELPDGETVREWALGDGYSTENIQAVIEGRSDWEAEPVTPESAASAYTALSRPAVAHTAVEISQKRIVGTVPAGLLIDVPETGKVFIDRRYIEKEAGSTTATVYLHPGGTYQAEADGSGVPIRGEELIHRLELAEGVQPVKVEITGDLICGLSSAGVSLSLPQQGIHRLFIESSAAEYHRTGSCCVALYPNWSYAFTDMDGQRRYITGRELARHLSASQRAVTSSLIGRINALQRRQNVAAARELAELLTLLREEGIREMPDFSTRRRQIDHQAALLKEAIRKAEEKSSQYQAVSRYLRIVQRTAPVNQEYQRLLPKAKKGFLAGHKQELDAYHAAMEQLEGAGVLPEVEPARVDELTERYLTEAARLKEELQALLKRAETLQAAMERIQGIQDATRPKEPPKRRRPPQER